MSHNAVRPWPAMAEAVELEVHAAVVEAAAECAAEVAE
jgi:hypothetical protein